jgi:hypothetical protein
VTTYPASSGLRTTAVLILEALLQANRRSLLMAQPPSGRPRRRRLAVLVLGLVSIWLAAHHRYLNSGLERPSPFSPRSFATTASVRRQAWPTTSSPEPGPTAAAPGLTKASVIRRGRQDP